MHKIWFKRELGGAECMADCPTIELAQHVWDTLSAAGYYMMSARP